MMELSKAGLEKRSADHAIGPSRQTFLHCDKAFVNEFAANVPNFHCRGTWELPCAARFLHIEIEAFELSRIQSDGHIISAH